MRDHGMLLPLWPDIYTCRPGSKMNENRLPGRLLMRMSDGYRKDLVDLVNGPPPADWWIKIVCGK